MAAIFYRQSVKICHILLKCLDVYCVWKAFCDSDIALLPSLDDFRNYVTLRMFTHYNDVIMGAITFQITSLTIISQPFI